jgi:hypothetical protein
VVVWSNNSVSSNWVKEEAEDGIERNCLVPAFIDPIVIPRGFRRLQAANFSDPDIPAFECEDWDHFIGRIAELVGATPQITPDQLPKKQAKHRPHGMIGQFPVGGGNGGQNLTPTGNVTTSDSTAANIASPSIAGDAATKPWWRQKTAQIGGALMLMLVAAIGYMAIPGMTAANVPPPPKDLTPVVLGIYPSDSFGPLQKRGLHLALEGVARDLTVLDLEATLTDLKTRQAPDMLTALENALRDRNVVAVVGSSITEFTPAILDTIEKSGRKPPVFLTAAGARDVFDWENRNIPIYRIGSGMDERAEQFATVAEDTVRDGRDIIFLVESIPNQAEPTFGEFFFRKISKDLPKWDEWVGENRVEKIVFQRGNIVESLTSINKQDIFDQNKLIIVLGLGSDYKALANEFYSANAPVRKALLGGWMTSFAVDPLYREQPMQFDRLFDMTDIFEQPDEAVEDRWSSAFEREYGTLSPLLRNEALTFESGLVVYNAFRRIDGKPTAEKLTQAIGGRNFTGINGTIRFDDMGRNLGPIGGVMPLNFIRFDGDSQKWTRITSLEEQMQP